MKHRLGVAARLIICAALVVVLFAALRSATLAAWIGSPFAGPYRLGMFPSLFLIFLAVVALLLRRNLSAPLPPIDRRHILAASIALILSFLLLALVTHVPSGAREDVRSFLAASPLVSRLAIGLPLLVAHLLLSASLLALLFPATFLRAHAALFLAGLIFLVTFLLASVLGQHFADVLVQNILALVAMLLAPFLPAGSLHRAGSTLTLGHFSVGVAPPCLGLDLTLAFLALAALPLLLQRERLRPLRALSVLLLFALILFALNAVRIAILLLIGAAFPGVAVMLFHSVLGSVLFLLAFVAYVRLLLPLTVSCHPPRPSWHRASVG